MSDPTRSARPAPVASEFTASYAPSVAMSVDETATGADGPAPMFAPPISPEDIGKLGPYRIVKQLGHGGMGAVYLAVDERLGRKLALKVMLPQFAANAAAKERFLREARAAAQITHDNVVTVYEADERDGVPFIAMQFLQGYPLDEYLQKKGAPGLPQILAIGRETAAGLAAAHAIGLVHRDIKPGNLWLEAPHGRIKVLDFGLARPVDSQNELTKSGAIVGTPAYMSPEQGRGQKVDGRTDLFSLGAVLYRLCTGRLPFAGSNVMAILTALATDEPTPVRDLNPAVPAALADLIRELLAKKADDRPQTADAVVERIRAIEGAAATASPMTTVPRVLYVPMQVTANPESAFADIASEDSDEVGSQAASKPVRKKSVPWLLIGSVFGFLVCAAVAAVVIIKITNKDGTVTEIRVPDGAKIEVDGNPVGPKKPEPLPTAPDLANAKWMLSLGGKVRVNGTNQAIAAAKELPKEAFRLTGIDLIGNKRVLDADLARFKDSKDLTWLDLAATDVTDAGLANFAGCKQLAHLSLHSSSIGDAGLGHFRGCKDLIELSLTNTKVTDAGLANFKDCKKLSTILMGNQLITDVGLSNFKGCKDLQSLYLADTPVSDTGLETFKECSGLSQLYLNGSKVTDRCVDQLLGYPKLKILWVQKTKVSAAKFEELKKAFPKCHIISDHGTYEPVDADRKAAEWVLSVRGIVMVNGEDREIKAIAELPKEAFELTGVVLDKNKGVTDLGLAVFKGIKSLKRLWLADNGERVTDAGLANFKDCKNLTGLWLQHTQVSDVGLAYFNNCKNLMDLHLVNTKVTDAGMANFQICENLTGLYLSNTLVGDTGLTNFRSCKNLQAVTLSGAQVTDVGWATFKECKNLTQVLLATTKVTDAGLASFQDCKKLTKLQLAGCPVTDVGLAHLKDCKTITSLDVQGTQVTDAGLAHIADFKELRFFNVMNTKVTAAKFTELKKAFPKCQIISDHGTYEPVDADRKAAEWVLSIGGTVGVNGSDDKVNGIADLPKEPFRLTRIELNGNDRVTDAGLAIFEGCKNLQFLWLVGNGERVTDAGLAHFKDCKDLIHLFLQSNTPVSDVGTGYFENCKNLTHLNLGRTQVTDAGLAKFKDCKKLKQLMVTGKLTDAGLLHFKDCEMLELLYLRGSQIGDVGVAPILNFKKLTELNIKKTKITAAKFDELKNALPKCRIESDHGTHEPKPPGESE